MHLSEYTVDTPLSPLFSRLLLSSPAPSLLEQAKNTYHPYGRVVTLGDNLPVRKLLSHWTTEVRQSKFELETFATPLFALIKLFLLIL